KWARARWFAQTGVNVNALGTGLCDTRMAHLPDRSWEDETKSLLWYRAGTPEDMASAICYLSGKSGDYLTGQIVCPNGGEWM
ncbi:MAG TPA: SDR family oxidoreductase, partial [Armatimonadota bacterium]|nr:SDR family oxidoreductase [Armatimonadota bacterium]